jgi:hypothetical protein
MRARARVQAQRIGVKGRKNLRLFLTTVTYAKQANRDEHEA